MRLESILKLHQFQQESGGLYLQLLCLRIPFCPLSLRERVSPKSLIGLEFRSRWSGRWFLAGFAVFGLVAVGKRNLAHELNGKKIN